MLKTIKKLVRDAVREGWKDVSTSKDNHIKLRAPTGKLVTISRTPSDYHAYKNILSDMRKALK